MKFYIHWIWILWNVAYEEAYWTHCDLSDRFWMYVWEQFKQD